MVLSRVFRRTTGVLVLVGALLPATALASHQRGIRVTVVGQNDATRSVEVDVTVYTQEDEGPSSAEPGESTPISVEWGEGESEGPIMVPGDGAVGTRAVYRTSLSHSYESDGPFVIRGSVECCDADETEMEAEGGAVGNPTEGEGFTDTANLLFGGPSVLEIPTASTVGLTILSVLLATVGFLLLRR